MKKTDDLDVTVLASPVQASALVTMLSLTVPSRRIAVAAAYLGVTENDVLRASGMTTGDRDYYVKRRVSHLDLPSAIMVRLARALAVPFTVLWDDEALESPVTVLKGRTDVSKDDKRLDRRRSGKRAAGHLRLAAG